MHRLFNTHYIRKTYEAGGVWDLEAGDYRGNIAVPSCWETIPQLASYKGKAVYRKVLEFGGNVRLQFKGVSHTADVYCDGEHVAHHYNAYTPFHAQLRREWGRHEIRVEVDNAYSPESTLHKENDYYTYGGIIKPVIVEELHDIFIERMHFTPYLKKGSWKASIDINIRSLVQEAGKVNLRVQLGEKECISEDIWIEGRACTVCRYECSFPQAEAYSMDQPRLYDLKASLYENGEAVDDLIDRVGFRQIVIDGKNILMNGKKIRLKGFNRHEDYNALGSSIPLQAMMRDIALIKESGANAVRTCHYPNDEMFLDLCDEYGLLVWEEEHARGLGEEQMRHPQFLPQSLQCIDEMIEDHYNHPSIFCWGILNECVSETEFGRSCYGRLFDQVTRNDASRPRTSASCRHFRDITLDLQDIISMNIYPQWYSMEAVEDTLGKLKKWIAETGNGNKPLIISEIGAGAIYGYRSDTNCRWSEEYQAQALEKQLSAVMADEDISAVFIWQFADVRVDDSWFAQRPKSQNNKGVVDEFRRKKLAYTTVQRLFSR